MDVHALQLRIQFCMCARARSTRAYSLCMHGANCARAREHACKLQRASTSYAAAAVIGYWIYRPKIATTVIDYRLQSLMAIDYRPQAGLFCK